MWKADLKNHGIKHSKEPNEMNPMLQKDLRNTMFHNDSSNNRFNGIHGSKSQESIFPPWKSLVCKMRLCLGIENDRWYMKGGNGFNLCTIFVQLTRNTIHFRILMVAQNGKSKGVV